ncbi:MAG: c-type cytochrome [Anaerolineales bacterium]|nr:c-type cytochrome [Anaerolineales bacterium]
MPRYESHNALLAAATFLTLAIVVTFQIYQLREPVRLQADAAADLEEAIIAGGELYQTNCTNCHGETGEGSIGPALNTRDLLENVSDDQLANLVRTGIPGTSMPAWSQAFGGPFTDEEVRQVVAYMGSWEPGEEEVLSVKPEPDVARGAEIFGSICVVCHGLEGRGTDLATALNDSKLLNSFDDEWFQETISQGRPNRGMPTWGTVLSPSQIDDLVALLGAWRRGEVVSIPQPDALHTSKEDGPELYAMYCAGCHGAEGEGGIGPSMRSNDFVTQQTDEALATLILDGRPGTSMTSFEGRLDLNQVQAIIALLQEWQ